jgi:membrane-associated phospholipid phosphatase
MVEMRSRSEGPRRTANRAARPEAQDLVLAAGALIYAAFSLVWPGTESVVLFGTAIPRGYGVALALIGLAAFALAAAPRLENGGPLLAFLRRFYPQACYPFFFMEGILLSAQALGVVRAALFGFQPSIEFSRAFGHLAAVNELMFASYFSFYLILAVTPWIAWFRGDREEAKRQVFDFTSAFVLLGIFYVFFRVQGPKYWFPELHEAWYGSFRGGVFVAFFQAAFQNVTLSGAAFPSSHIVITVLSVRAAQRMDKRLLAIYIPVAVLLSLATVYIYAHYAADVLGGALTGLALAPLFLRLRPRIEALCGRKPPLGAAAAR